ncbi:hypothetical protein JOC70_000707 [Clostridium pascui]|uniref:hypothetical protein n=1 Tax=Clostridium pascui TaxID=46609 RepID=UPI001958AB57|nr:hypothetical protein [Clostridium pascui]MBM7869238.1 hypothetical protein [Clostridium pascui]
MIEMWNKLHIVICKKTFKDNLFKEFILRQYIHNDLFCESSKFNDFYKDIKDKYKEKIKDEKLSINSEKNRISIFIVDIESSGTACYLALYIFFLTVVITFICSDLFKGILEITYKDNPLKGVIYYYLGGGAVLAYLCIIIYQSIKINIYCKAIKIYNMALKILEELDEEDKEDNMAFDEAATTRDNDINEKINIIDKDIKSIKKYIGIK